MTRRDTIYWTFSPLRVLQGSKVGGNRKLYDSAKYYCYRFVRYLQFRLLICGIQIYVNRRVGGIARLSQFVIKFSFMSINYCNNTTVVVTSILVATTGSKQVTN